MPHAKRWFGAYAGVVEGVYDVVLARHGLTVHLDDTARRGASRVRRQAASGNSGDVAALGDVHAEARACRCRALKSLSLVIPCPSLVIPCPSLVIPCPSLALPCNPLPLPCNPLHTTELSLMRAQQIIAYHERERARNAGARACAPGGRACLHGAAQPRCASRPPCPQHWHRCPARRWHRCAQHWHRCPAHHTLRAAPRRGDGRAGASTSAREARAPSLGATAVYWRAAAARRM